MQEYQKAAFKAKNLAEERESKLKSLIQLLNMNHLPLLETRGVPLMQSIRKLTF
jgi:hypothetical protein